MPSNKNKNKKYSSGVEPPTATKKDEQPRTLICALLYDYDLQVDLYNTTVLDTYKVAGAMYTELDSGIETVIAALKAKKMWDNTVLIFVSGAVARPSWLMPLFDFGMFGAHFWDILGSSCYNDVLLLAARSRAKRPSKSDKPQSSRNMWAACERFFSDASARSVCVVFLFNGS